MVSKRNFQNGRPMLHQQRPISSFKQPCGPPGGAFNNFQHMMFNGSQLPDNPGYMDFNNPSPPVGGGGGVGTQNGRSGFAQQQQNKKKNNNKTKLKNKQQLPPSQQNQQRQQQNQLQQQNQQNYQQQQQQQQQQHHQQLHQQNGNWNKNRNMHQMGVGCMHPPNRFNGNMQRGGIVIGGGFNPLHSVNGGPLNRVRRFIGHPGMGIGPMPPIPPHGFQPLPPIPPMSAMGGRGTMPPPMGGRGPMPPMGIQPPPPFLRRNGRGPMPMHPIPPPIPPMLGPQRMQRISLPPPLFNGIGKIKKPNAKLLQQKIVKNKSSVKTLKTLINQYPIDRPWVTDDISAAHNKKLDLEQRLKCHKDDELFAQFKTQRDTFVALYEKAREEFLKQEAAAVKAKDANDKETLSKNVAAAKNGNNMEVIPIANAPIAQV